MSANWVGTVGAVGLSRSPVRRFSASVRVTVPETVGELQAVAQKTTVQLVDDIDGSVAEETVSFGLDGTGYWS